MKWPLVTRATYEAERKECAALRLELAIVKVQNGLLEVEVRSQMAAPPQIVVKPPDFQSLPCS